MALLSLSHAGVSGALPGHTQAPSLPGCGRRAGLAGCAPRPRDSVDSPRVVLAIELVHVRLEVARLQTAAAVRAAHVRPPWATDCVVLAVVVGGSSTFVFLG